MITPAYHHFNEVTSTSDIAIEMARNGATEGTVVTADRQTKGRGRRGRIWHDKPGESVLMSIILRPDKSVSEIPRLSIAASLAVAQCLESECGLSPEIKWPNDVLISGKKISGILVDVCLSPTLAAVVGIGINVLQSSFPPDIADIATSIAIENGSCRNVEKLTQVLVAHLLENYQVYLSSSFKEILDQWRKYMWGICKQVTVTTEGDVIEGAISGVDDNGALLIVDAHKFTHTILAADAVKLNMERLK